MPLLLWFLLFFLGSCLMLLLPVLWGWGIFNRHRWARAVTCPRTHQQVAVSFDAWHAAVTGLSRKPDLRLSDCTQWPDHADCDQCCIPDALRSELHSHEAELPRAKRIYHLPVLISAFVALIVGVFWHSQYLFRAQWTEASGLDRLQLRPIVHSWTPHLLTSAICVLFAYGVAWLLAWGQRRGVWRGIATASALWLALALASLAATGFAGVSREFLQIEAIYTFLASLLIGAIIGGLSGKLVMPELET